MNFTTPHNSARWASRCIPRSAAAGGGDGKASPEAPDNNSIASSPSATRLVPADIIRQAYHGARAHPETRRSGEAQLSESGDEIAKVNAASVVGLLSGILHARLALVGSVLSVTLHPAGLLARLSGGHDG